MTEFERRVALLARVHALERQAAALTEAARDGAMRTEARSLMETLRRTRAFLEAAPSGPGLEESEHVVDSASLLLASLGPDTPARSE
jgi:hypothetical protein